MNSKTLLTVILIVASLALIKIFLIGNKTTGVSAPQPQGKVSSAVVTAYVVKSEKFDKHIFATGSILANEEVELKPEASGRIVELFFKEGSTVNKGDLLVKLNDADLRAQFKKLELQWKLAGEKEARAKKLLDIKGISQEEYDATLNQVNSLKADMESVQARLAETEIRAPFSGIIGLKSVSEGSYVSPTVRIASIQQLDPVKVDFSVPEKYSSMVHKGEAIYFTVQGDTGQYKGEIYAIEPKIDPLTRSLLLRAVCSNKQGKILPGAFAKIELVLQQSDSTLLIPTEAIIPELKGQKVFVSRGGTAQSQKVVTGLRTDTRIEITQGLHVGDTVITTGIMQLKPGIGLKIAEIK